MATPNDDSINQDEISYIPVRTLGRGAFGKAVLYRRLNDGVLVVWKELIVSPLSDKNRKEAYNEIEILSSINHFNIIKYLNHFFDNDIFCIELEYADGGSLYDKILKQEKQNTGFRELDIKWFSYQLMAAVSYIHSIRIMHRDIKTMNIFLTKSEILKLGDFGISKALNATEDLASSCVGTPYYMSPEIIRGENYDYKSDVWACGCVLFELATLGRAYDATGKQLKLQNALRLAHEIVSKDVPTDAIDRTRYSVDLVNVICEMLNKDYKKRIGAEEVFNHKIFSKVKSTFDERIYRLIGLSAEKKFGSVSSLVSEASANEGSNPIVTTTSVTTELYIWGGGKIAPQLLEPFAGGSGRPVIEVSAGIHHFAALTMEGEVYTWVDGASCQSTEGELGHGDLVLHKIPRKIQHFETFQMLEVSCGEYFTICRTNDGTLYSFGSNDDGCLGQGEEIDCAIEPLPIELPSLTRFSSVTCGDRHVLATGLDGRLFTWGCGEYGRLGHGNEDDCFTPRPVDYLPPLDEMSVVSASSDASMIVCQNGAVYAAGSNEFNKLGLSTNLSGVEKGRKANYDIPVQTKFSIVKPLKSHTIVFATTGPSHSVCIDSAGVLLTFGSNKYGQLGQGDYKPRPGRICRVLGPLVGHDVRIATTGDGFTIAILETGAIYSWGRNNYGQLGQGAQGVQSISIPFQVAVPQNNSVFRRISAISSQSWHTISVFQNVYNHKVMKHGSTSQSSLSSLRSAPSSDSESPVKSDSPINIVQSQESFKFNDNIEAILPEESAEISRNNSLEESEVPEWLRKDFEEAEAAQDKIQTAAVLPNVSEEIKTINLEKRIEELVSENTKLRQMLDEQENVIAELRANISASNNSD